MKKLIVLGIVAVLGIIFVASYVGFSNDANRLQNAIVAQWDQNRNNQANMRDKFMEMAQVPSMARDDAKALYDAAMKGRYGADGSKALLQFIKEQNPTIDASLYVRLSVAIEAGRNAFEADQKQLISKRQELTNLLTATTGGRIFNTFAHYPTIDLSKYDIVTSDQTEEDFRTKRAKPIQLR